jgi:HTH-type transcriptional regulator / antitoxin HigA
MDIRPIKNEEDYDWALAEISQYFENEPQLGTPEADRFDVLAALIGAYEDEHWPIEPSSDPIDIIKAHMAALDKKQEDLAGLLGSRSRASEVLNRRRGLTLEMVHKISTKWHIPADILVRPYHLETDRKKTAKKRAA